MPVTLFASVQMQREKQTAWAQTGIPLSARLLNQSRKAVGFKKVHFPRWLLYCQEWLPINSKAFAIHQQRSFCSKCNSPFTAPGIYRSHVVCGCCAFLLKIFQQIQPQGHGLQKPRWRWWLWPRVTTIIFTTLTARVHKQIHSSSKIVILVYMDYQVVTEIWYVALCFILKHRSTSTSVAEILTLWFR